MRMLIVEDDRGLARALAHILKRHRWDVDAAHDGEEGLRFATTGTYDAIIFDIMLPKMDGIAAVRALRQRGIATPVLMLTARDQVPDKIEGLDGGADAYMTKPFAAPELLARLRALVRRTVDEPVRTVDAGDLQLRPETHSLACGSEDIQLSHKEFALAEVLLAHAGTVVTKAALIQQVWGTDSSADSTNLEAYVSMLRRKLRFLGSRVQIKSQRGVGYKLMDEDAPC